MLAGGFCDVTRLQKAVMIQSRRKPQEVRYGFDEGWFHSGTDRDCPWLCHGHPLQIYEQLRRVQRRSVHHSVYDRNENTDDTAHDQTAENHKTHVCHESGDPGDPEEV